MLSVLKNLSAWVLLLFAVQGLPRGVICLQACYELHLHHWKMRGIDANISFIHHLGFEFISPPDWCTCTCLYLLCIQLPTLSTDPELTQLLEEDRGFAILPPGGILIHCICNFCTFTKLQTRLLIIFQWEAPHSRPRETDMLPKRGNRWRGNKQIPSSHRWPGNKYEALLVLIFGEIWVAVLHERFKEGYRCDGKGSEKMNFAVDRLVVYTMCTTHQVRQ